jgi:hypothetical protein
MAATSEQSQKIINFKLMRENKNYSQMQNLTGFLCNKLALNYTYEINKEKIETRLKSLFEAVEDGCRICDMDDFKDHFGEEENNCLELITETLQELNVTWDSCEWHDTNAAVRHSFVTLFHLLTPERKRNANLEDLMPPVYAKVERE